MTRSQETIFSDVSEESLPQPASLNPPLLRGGSSEGSMAMFLLLELLGRIRRIHLKEFCFSTSIFGSPTQEEGVDHTYIGSLAYIEATELGFFIDTGGKYTRL